MKFFPFLGSRRAFAYAIAFLTLTLTATVVSARTRVSPNQVRLDESIKAIPNGSAAALGPAELAQSLNFMVALQMRDYPELVARIGHGEVISAVEMTEKYLPLASDYNATVNWLTTQGFTVTKTDPSHLAVFVSGNVDRIAQVFQMTFGKINRDNESFTSAISAPTVPTGVASAIVGINGLQPHIKPQKLSRWPKHQNARFAEPATDVSPSPQIVGEPPYLVYEILSAYNATNVGVLGTNQKIAVVIDTFPEDKDLTAFWTINGIGQALSNIEKVKLETGDYPKPTGEETLDVEWTSSIAPAAKIRIYGTKELSFVNVDEAFQQIINDVQSQAEPNLHQVSISLGSGEGDVGNAQLVADSQYFTTMAALGLSVFVSSGDAGSKEGGVTQVSYFASDPNVTAVGGTSLFLSNCTGLATYETSWDFGGGGVSGFFSRPAWQTAPGMPSGTTRLVPDVALAADPSTGAFIVLNGSDLQIGGTSWSAPVWAGFSALINEARANANLPPVGLLGPKIYPLAGTTAFRDIVCGNNGDYDATIGFDLTTGLGVPNIDTLVAALSTNVVPPATPPVAPCPLDGQMLTPDSACPLNSSSPTFNWTAGSAMAYLLTVTDDRNTQLFNSSQTGLNFYTVPNLPTDGRKLHVTLRSFVNGVWFTPAQAYTYTAYPGTVLAPIIAPSSGKFKKKVVVNIATQTPGATIYYTTNNTIPTTNSNKFTGPFTLATKGTVIIRAKAVMSGVTDSPAVFATLIIK